MQQKSHIIISNKIMQQQGVFVLRQHKSPPHNLSPALQQPDQDRNILIFQSLLCTMDVLGVQSFPQLCPPPLIVTANMPPLFLGQFSQNSLVGDAWLKVSLVLQHTLYHPPKS